MVQHGRRAVYEPAAVASEKPTPSNESEYRRKVRMFEHCWLIVLRGKMLAASLGPLYTLQIVSHRFLRYALGPAPPRPARDLDRARDARLGLRRRARGAARSCSPPLRPASGSPATTSSSPGRRWSRSGTTCVAASRRRGRRRRGPGEPRSRCHDRGARPRDREPGARRGGARREARGPRAGALPADEGGEGRPRLRAAEAADDGRRRREDGRRVRRRPGRLADHAGRAPCCGACRSTSCRSSGT